MTKKLNRLKKQTSLGFEEFTNLTGAENKLPEEDSPGDSGDDELTETLLGMEYEEEDPEELVGKKSARYKSAQLKDTETGEEIHKISDRLRVVSSERPDPAEDLDKPTSTH